MKKIKFTDSPYRGGLWTFSAVIAFAHTRRNFSSSVKRGVSAE